MLQLVYNELEKLVKRKRILVILAFMLLLSGMGIYSAYRNAKNGERWNSPQGQLERIENNIKWMQQDLENPETTEAQKEDIQKSIEEQKQEIAVIQKKLSGQWDWKAELKKEVDASKKSMNEEAQDSVSAENPYLMEREYLLDHELEPLPFYKLNAFKLFNDVMEFMTMIFIPLLAIVMAADVISSEFQPPTIKLIMTRPVQRWKIVVSKYVAVVLSVAFVIAVAQLAVFLFGGFAFGWGGGEYPQTLGTQYRMVDVVRNVGMGAPERQMAAVEGSTFILPVWQFTLLSALYNMFTGIVMASLAFAVSSIIRNSSIAMVFSVLAGVGSFVIAAMFGFKSIMIANYMNYMDLGRIWKGSAAASASNPSITLGLAFLILGIWTLIAFAVSFAVFTKREAMV